MYTIEKKNRTHLSSEKNRHALATAKEKAAYKYFIIRKNNWIL